MSKYQTVKRLLSVIAAVVVIMATVGGVMPLAANAQTLKGDIDTDGRLSMLDVMTLYGYTSGITASLTAAQIAAADANGNGVVDMLDVMTLFMYVSYGVAPEPSPDKTVLCGIDVSYAQGTIDWHAVTASETVDFAILRCGYGQDEEAQDDTMWETNAAACEAVGMPYGAYFFCYARNEQEAAGEAQHALRLLEGKSLTYPIFYDMEYSSWQGNLTEEEYAAIAKVFCQTLEEAGYTVGVYSNLDWWRYRLTDPCFDGWYRWVAQYNDTCDYEGIYQVWQYSDNGYVDGIDHTVDMNYAYVDFSSPSQEAVTITD